MNAEIHVDQDDLWNTAIDRSSASVVPASLLGHAGTLAPLSRPTGLVILVNALLLLRAAAVMPSTWLWRWSRRRRHRRWGGDAESIASLRLVTERTAGALITAYHARLGR
ncbi:hypothetical protein XPA_007849 [Xanthoria parietina]